MVGGTEDPAAWRAISACGSAPPRNARNAGPARISGSVLARPPRPALIVSVQVRVRAALYRVAEDCGCRAGRIVTRSRAAVQFPDPPLDPSALQEQQRQRPRPPAGP